MPTRTRSPAPSRAVRPPPAGREPLRGLAALPALLLLAAACGQIRVAGPAPSTPREDYERRLSSAGSGEERRAREWAAAGERALAAATRAQPPYAEAFHFAAGSSAAVAYRLELARGARLRVEVEPPFLRRGGVFIELFLVADPDAGNGLRVAQARGDDHTLELDVRHGAEYLLRIQPALGHEGLYRIRIRDETRAAPAKAALTFPVAGRDAGAIRGRFGAPREGGRRRHNGVDIFAPRGTPVLAAADGVIGDVEVTALGGRVIWLEAEGGDVVFYYAHLDEQLVKRGARVRAGEVIGRVGNTGNARGASPHLHFGVYRGGRGRGPVDPAPLLRPQGGAQAAAQGTAEPIAGDIGALGGSARATEDAVPVHAAPAAEAAVVDTLSSAMRVRLLGATGEWYRVELPDGAVGFVPAGRVEVLP